MLEILKYLIENYIIKEVLEEAGEELNPAVLKHDLKKGGFTDVEIRAALKWLEMLSEEPEGGEIVIDSDAFSRINHLTRIFAPEETAKIGIKGCSFMLQLEMSGMITPEIREMIMDNVMLLKFKRIDTEQLRWIALIIMFYKSGYSSPADWLSDIREKMKEQLH